MFVLNVHIEDILKLRVSFECDQLYPDIIPKISLSSPGITRNSSDLLKSELEKYTKSLLGQPMIMDIVMWLQEHATKYMNQDTHISERKESLCEKSSEDEETGYIAALHLDHIRAKTKYVKTIQKWTKEFNLTGFLAFCESLILIILEGRQRDVRVCIKTNIWGK